MKCAIMQPAYFPWAGFFNLMAQVDVFIYLDDVQYRKRYWQQRNRIVIDGQDRFISVPVLSKGKQEQLIKEVRIDDQQPWRLKHKASILHAYARHPYLKDLTDSLNILEDHSLQYLADLNIALINYFAEHLDLKCRCVCSSHLNVSGKRSQYLISLCKLLGCNKYLSPVGAAGYLTEDDVFNGEDVKLEFQNYIPLPYEQRGTREFISHLSILDVLANLGWDKTKAYVRYGRG